MREKDLDQRHLALEARTEEVAKNIQSSRDEHDRASAHKEEAMRQRLAADAERTQAQTALREAESVKHEAIRLQAVAVEALLAIEAREKDLKRREEENQRISKELEDDTIRLADRKRVREKILHNLDGNRGTRS